MSPEGSERRDEAPHEVASEDADHSGRNSGEGPGRGEGAPSEAEGRDLAEIERREARAPAAPDPVTAIEQLLVAAKGLADPAGRAALLAGAQAALAGLARPGAPSTPDRATASLGEAPAAKRVLDLEAERRRRAGGA